MYRHVTRSTILLCLTAALGACDTAVEPEVPFSVEIQATPAPPVLRAEGAQARMECTATLVARATGSGRSQAVWKNGIFRFRTLDSEGVQFDSLMVSAPDIQAEWGSPTIGKSDRQEATWILWATVPFSISGEIRYAMQSTGLIRSAPFSFNCGPDVPPGGAAMPEIRDVQFSHALQELEPLDTLTVTYAASSPLGLRRTGVIVSGAYEQVFEFAEHLQTATTRTVRLAVPQTSTLGRRVEVRVFALDAVMQATESPTRISAPLVDRSPPVATILTGACAFFRCEYAVGDSIPLQVSAADNHSLAWLIYEIGEHVITRDSIRLSGNRWWGTVMIPARAEWVGSPAITVYVRDASGNTSPATGIAAGLVHVYPMAQRPRHDTVIEGVFVDAQIASKRNVLYLSQRGRSEIRVFSLPTLAPGTPIPLPAEPAGFDLSLSGDSLLVVLPTLKAIGIVNLKDSSQPVELVAITAVDPATAPPAQSLRAMANGKWFVTMSDYPSASHLVEIDPAMGTQVVRPLPGRRAPGDGIDPLVRSGDRSRMLVSGTEWCAYLYDAVGNSIGPCKAFHDNPREIAVDFSGNRFAGSEAIYDAGFDRIRYETARPHATTGISPDGQHVYRSTDSGIHVKHTDIDIAIERIPAPRVSGRLLFSDDGALLVGVDRERDQRTRLVVVDLR